MSSRTAGNNVPSHSIEANRFLVQSNVDLIRERHHVAPNEVGNELDLVIIREEKVHDHEHDSVQLQRLIGALCLLAPLALAVAVILLSPWISFKEVPDWAVHLITTSSAGALGFYFGRRIH